MFAGLHFSSNSICNTCIPNTNVTSITLQSGIYNDIFCSDNPDKDTKDWDYDTRFYAKFQNNLYAGNVDYSASNVSMMRIKRRKNNEHEWIRIHEIPIANNDDFDFEFYDKYAQACQDYSYALIPMIGSVEGNMSSSKIFSEFDAYFITDKTISYPVMFNTSLSLEIQRQTSIINTLGNKYPYVISNATVSFLQDTDSHDTVSYIVFLFAIAYASALLHLNKLKLNALDCFLRAWLQELKMIVAGINLCAGSGAEKLEFLLLCRYEDFSVYKDNAFLVDDAHLNCDRLAFIAVSEAQCILTGNAWSNEEHCLALIACLEILLRLVLACRECFLVSRQHGLWQTFHTVGFDGLPYAVLTCWQRFYTFWSNNSDG